MVLDVPHALKVSDDADGLGTAAMVILLTRVVHALHYHDGLPLSCGLWTICISRRGLRLEAIS